MTEDTKNPLIKMPETGDLVVVVFPDRRGVLYPGKTGLINKVENIDLDTWAGYVYIDWVDGSKYVGCMDIVNLIQRTYVSIDGKLVSW